MASISYKINELREAKKLTKTAFAELIGVNRDTVYNLSDESIKVSTLLKISEKLDVPVSFFFSSAEATKTKNFANEPEVKYGDGDCAELRHTVAILREQNLNNQETIKALNHAINTLNQQLEKQIPLPTTKKTKA
ncbi:MAG: Cro/C1-type DNA-binding domain [Bacteroidota bacterium]|jgi:transcriptional regulator with XRE-family HTH domain|nr:Cro/C1-type DNA-binding domain [Bacteroidota bacterium]